ncbi:hypothetical protein R1sor_008091 [Riccia sorocarpa]|uniref:Uncharacterized protein n=1 Tax=Riccia sorocarpa TaxID=122646 RepID=A0ABD3HSC3_9MARC
MENQSRIRSVGSNKESSGSRHVEAFPKKLGRPANGETASIEIVADVAKNKEGGVGRDRSGWEGGDHVRVQQDKGVLPEERRHDKAEEEHMNWAEGITLAMLKQETESLPMTTEEHEGRDGTMRIFEMNIEKASCSPVVSGMIKEKEREEDGFVMVGRKKQGSHTGSEKVQGEKVVTSNSFQILEKRRAESDEGEEQRIRDIEKITLEFGQNSGWEIRRKEVSGEASNKGGERERGRKAVEIERAVEDVSASKAHEKAEEQELLKGKGAEVDSEEEEIGWELLVKSLRELKKSAKKTGKNMAEEDHKNRGKGESSRAAKHDHEHQNNPFSSFGSVLGNTEKRLELGHEISFQGGEMWSPQGRVPKMRSKGGLVDGFFAGANLSTPIHEVRTEGVEI